MSRSNPKAIGAAVQSAEDLESNRDLGDETGASGWGSATPLEILEAKVQAQAEAIDWLAECLSQALYQCAQRDGSPVRPEVVLDEEWSK